LSEDYGVSHSQKRMQRRTLHLVKGNGSHASQLRITEIHVAPLLDFLSKQESKPRICVDQETYVPVTATATVHESPPPHHGSRASPCVSRSKRSSAWNQKRFP